MKSFREIAVSEAKKYFEVFSKLEVKYVTIHANWPPAMFSTKEGIKFQVETLRKMVAEAKKYNICLMYELIDTWQDDLKSVHLDIGHANLFEKRPEQFIEKFHNKLKHVHLHDNDGEKDLHLPLGTGSINWENLIKILKKYYNGTITLEIFSRDKDYVLLSKEKLRKLWNKRR